MLKTRDLRNLALGLALGTFGLYALAVTIPNTFAPGTTISASQVNANFNAVKTAVNGLEAKFPVGSSDIQDATIGPQDLANGAVTKPKLAAAGGAAGQVLKFDGTNLVWANDDLKLPFEGTVNTSNPVFKVTNTGTGAGLLGVHNDTGNTASIANNQTGLWGRAMHGFAGLIGEGFNGHRGVAGVSDTGAGVTGQSTSSTGVHGETGSGIGVIGRSTAGGSAAFFLGGSGGGGSCTYNGGAGWLCTSDRNAKENFRAVNPEDVLKAVNSVPVSRYTMKGDLSASDHIGPTAQDFYAAFRLGDSDKTINTADAQGVAFAAIQGLYQENQALKVQLAALEARLVQLEQAR